MLVTRPPAAEKWPATITDPTFADAILKCPVHHAYTLNLKRESMRRTKG